MITYDLLLARQETDALRTTNQQLRLEIINGLQREKIYESFIRRLVTVNQALNRQNRNRAIDSIKSRRVIADLQDVIAHQAEALLEHRAVMISLDHPVYQAVEVSSIIPQDID